MIYSARVTYVFHPYMDDETKEETKFHTIVAATQEDAKRKIENHYKTKSDDYGDNYTVIGTEFFEHIS